MLSEDETMHEIGIVDDIVSAVRAKLKDVAQDSRVKKVNIAIGELEHVTPDHFEFHFRERTKDTSLEGAELCFKKVEARFRCKGCGFEFSAKQGLSGCPKCKAKTNDAIEGTGVHVESVELA